MSSRRGLTLRTELGRLVAPVEVLMAEPLRTPPLAAQRRGLAPVTTWAQSRPELPEPATGMAGIPAGASGGMPSCARKQRRRTNRCDASKITRKHCRCNVFVAGMVSTESTIVVVVVPTTTGRGGGVCVCSIFAGAGAVPPFEESQNVVITLTPQRFISAYVTKMD